MKKIAIAFAAGSICIIAIALFTRFYYPPLPLDTMSKREVLEKANATDQQMVKLTNEAGHEWYITGARNQSIVNEQIKEMVGQRGWIFKQQEGSGLFFEKQGDNLIVTTQKWTSDYTLIKIPATFTE